MTYTTHTYLLSFITATLLVGCGGASSNKTNTPSSTDIQETTSTTQCQNIVPVLKKLDRKYALTEEHKKVTHIAYRDSDNEEHEDSNHGSSARDNPSHGSSNRESSSHGSSNRSHNEGKNCLTCHSFASAGTVFHSLHAANNTNGASGYRIKLSAGIVYDSARGTGNSRTSSFPNTKFTAQVMNPSGNIVNSSADMSHDGSRRACNSCHSASGNNGAPGRITSKHLTPKTPNTPIITTPTTSCVSFNKNVLPILTNKCKNCHGANGRFEVSTANTTYANISALKESAKTGGQYLLDKSSNTIGHAGGEVIAKGSAEYTTIKAWIDASAPNN